MSSRDQPWITPKIKLLMKQKDRLYHRGNKLRYLIARDQLLKEINVQKAGFATK